MVLPPTDPGTPRAAVLPPPEGRSLDASVADVQQLLARHGHVVVVCPTSAPAAVEHRLHAVRSLLESDRIALVRTDLPPLGAAVLVRQLCLLAGCDFSPGVLASAARLLAHYIYAGAVLGSVSRLDRVPVGLGSHLKSWLPGAHFAVLAGPTPQMVRVGDGEGALAGPEFATELLLARGRLQTDWPTTTLVPRWRIPGPVQETALPAASPGWWGTGKLVEFAAYLPDLSVLHQLVSSVRRETCHWCGMDLIGDRCGFCTAPLTHPEPGGRGYEGGEGGDPYPETRGARGTRGADPRTGAYPGTGAYQGAGAYPGAGAYQGGRAADPRAVGPAADPRALDPADPPAPHAPGPAVPHPARALEPGAQTPRALP
ncbi:hypothetical protein ADL06_28595 [Streptomyces sp. NRRL F-6491]|nr:hypothetical protein ADL06_28595 [Streptomyces sp. NRRL F-6491]KOX37903.1 hypothetical protein ADL08_28310 [Streptomyces sp. NRRL F-6492]